MKKQKSLHLIDRPAIDLDVHFVNMLPLLKVATSLKNFMFKDYRLA